mmetsp:Transcript_51496/g.101685  ORF Transcript_51496/g.101685 Transcript_51496/m.101685 type:complete len:203 (-) Transcript_51496:139-747(-)
MDVRRVHCEHLTDVFDFFVRIAKLVDCSDQALAGVPHILQQHHHPEEHSSRHDVANHDELDHRRGYNLVTFHERARRSRRNLAPQHDLIVAAAFRAARQLRTLLLPITIPMNDNARQLFGHIVPNDMSRGVHIPVLVLVGAGQPGDRPEHPPRVREPEALLGPYVAKLPHRLGDTRALPALVEIGLFAGRPGRHQRHLLLQV